jgi:uncharacterized membrane protein YeaQ/YmgE (transglycosylase-associated protein family)
MDFLWFIIIGVLAGWLTGQVMKGSGYGLFGDLVLGVLGAIAGGWLLGLVGVTSGGLLGRLLVATFGAIVLVFISRLIKKSA